MGLLTQLSAGGIRLPGIGGGLPLGFTTAPAGVPFLKTLVASDFGLVSGTDITVTAGTYATIGTYTISAQRFATFGQGNTALDPANQGKIFMDLQDCSRADLDGLVRLVLANANETETKVILEERTEKLSENPTDITKWLRLIEYPLKGSEDSKLLLQFKADGSGTKTIGVDSAQPILYVDVTEFQ